MKNYFFKQKSVWISIFVNVIIFSMTFLMFKFRCFGVECSVEQLRGVIFPLFWFGLFMTLVTAFFIFFQETIFKSWLKKIAWWYGLVLIVATATTPIYSSNVLSVDRSQVVLVGMTVLAIITVLFVLITKNRLK